MSDAGTEQSQAGAAIYLARQPVFDRDMAVIAYELLFRPGAVDSADIIEPDQATARVLMNATSEFDLCELLDGKPAFINFSRNLLMSAPAFDSEQFVIEIGESVDIDWDLIAVVRELWGQGFLVSLDSFTPDCPRTALLPFARYVGIDTQNRSPDEIKAIYDALRAEYPDITIIAEKIESAQLIKSLWKMGLDAFQGYFFCRPEIVEGARIPNNKLVVLKLMKEVRDPDINMADLEKTLSRDSSLSFKLLRLVNSAAFRRASSVESIRHALSMLGMSRVRSWVSMVALCDLGDKPEELQRIAIIRARTCELLAQKIGASEEQYFTLGLFSLLDAFFDKPMAELLKQVNLSAELATALTERGGDMGRILDAVILQEQGQWNDIDANALEQLGISLRDISDAWIEGTSWARETLSEMQRED